MPTAATRWGTVMGTWKITELTLPGPCLKASAASTARTVARVVETPAT